MMASRLDRIGNTRSGASARSGETEYGGRVSSPQIGSEDGSVQHVLTDRERARVLRTHGMRTESGEVRLDGEPWAEGVARKEEALERVNGYDVEDVQ